MVLGKDPIELQSNIKEIKRLLSDFESNRMDDILQMYRLEKIIDILENLKKFVIIKRKF